MTILITLTTIGTDCSLFDIYSNIDGFISTFETDIPKASLSAGFSSANVPNGTSIIRIKAKGLCSNYIDLTLSELTTTTTSSSSSTTTTTTSTPTNNTWSIVNQDCGGLATLNSVSVNDASMSSFSPLTSTLSVSRTNPNGVNYGSSDNKIMVGVSNIPSGTRTARILVRINNGSREYYTDFTTNPFPTVNNVLINSGDSVKVILQCIPL